MDRALTQFKPAALYRVSSDRKTKIDQIDYNKSNTLVILEKAAFTIGRLNGSDILLRSEHKVSRTHAWIHWTNSKWWIVDKNSRNGTILNDFKIPPDHRIQLISGSRINFHGTGYSFIFVEDVIGQASNSVLCNLSSDYKALQNQMILEQIRLADAKARFAKANPFLSELICAICSEYFVSPKVLNCSHTFCEWCITNWTKEDSRRNINSKCPMCREPIRTVTKVLFVETMVPLVLAQILTADEVEEWKRLCRERNAELETLSSTSNNQNHNHHHRPQAVVFPVRQVQHVPGDPSSVGNPIASRNHYENDDDAETDIASTDEDEELDINRLRTKVKATSVRKRALKDQTGGHRQQTRSQSEHRRAEHRNRSINATSRNAIPNTTPTQADNYTDLIPESWFQTPRPGQSRTSALRQQFETLAYAPAPRNSTRSRHQSGRW